MVVKDNGEIAKIEWEFRGFFYKIIASESSGKTHSVWQTLDTIKRNDGMIKTFTRRQLKKYFDNN